MFALCVYADRERWIGGIEPLLYPTGMTFYRPFSYRAEYFAPVQLAAQLVDPSQRRSLLSQPNWNQGFIGLRFRTEALPEYLPRFIPLRCVAIDHVEIRDGINLHFVLGNYVTPHHGDGNAPFLPSLDITEALANLTETKLFVHLTENQRATAAAWHVQEEFPDRFWDAFTRVLSPAAMENFRNTVVLRLTSLNKRGHSTGLKLSVTDRRYNSAGYRLQELTTYDLMLSYYRLVQPGDAAPPVEYQYSVTNPTDEIQSSRRNIRVLGNYRAEKIWIAPLKAVHGPIEISIEPTRLGQADVPEDQTAAKTVGLKIPAVIRRRRWPGARILNLILFLVTAASSIMMFRYYSCVEESTQKIILVLLATSFAVMINAVKDFFLTKS